MLNLEQHEAVDPQTRSSASRSSASSASRTAAGWRAAAFRTDGRDRGAGGAPGGGSEPAPEDAGAGGEQQPEPELPPRVLVVGGSDSSGSAGLQADWRVLADFGVYGLTAVTAVTAQDTVRLHQAECVDPFLVERQMLAALEDVGADCIKIGMLGTRAAVELVARVCERAARHVPVVLDPVFHSTSGAELLDPAGQATLLERLMPLSAVVTPNAEEARALTGIEVREEGDLYAAADRLLLLGQDAVYLKGGHLSGEVCTDLLRTADGLERRFEASRATQSPRGTGCALATAIAAGLASGHTLEHAATEAHRYVASRIAQAQRLGAGPPCLLGLGGPPDRGRG